MKEIDNLIFDLLFFDKSKKTLYYYLLLIDIQHVNVEWYREFYSLDF